jgi:hypothetical protein
LSIWRATTRCSVCIATPAFSVIQITPKRRHELKAVVAGQLYASRRLDASRVMVRFFLQE